MENFATSPGRSGMPPSRCAAVLVVDDHPGVRTGLTLLIDAERPRLCSAGAAANGAEALALARRLQPGLVLLDVDLGGEDGLALIPLLQREAPCRVVVLTSVCDARLAQRALSLGAWAFMHKLAPAKQLIEQLIAAAQATRPILSA